MEQSSLNSNYNCKGNEFLKANKRVPQETSWFTSKIPERPINALETQDPDER